MSALSSQDKATHAIHDLITILRNPGPETPFLEYGPKVTTNIEQLSDIFSTNTAPNQQDPSPMTKHQTNTPISEPTKKSIPPTPTNHAAPRVTEQPLSPSVDTTPAYPRVPEQETQSP